VTEISRRRFLRMAALGGVGAVTFVGGAGVVAMLMSDRVGRRERVRAEMTVPRAELPATGGTPYRNTDGQFYLIQNEDGALALSWECTHQRCFVRWSEGRGDFECPCHASHFDRYGVVTTGPAPRPLELMPVRVAENGDVIVDTRETIVRDEYEPEQAVPIAGAGRSG
jgi:cytochrome b6-f complex iron-sulfur subunit